MGSVRIRGMPCEPTVASNCPKKTAKMRPPSVQNVRILKKISEDGRGPNERFRDTPWATVSLSTPGLHPGRVISARFTPPFYNSDDASSHLDSETLPASRTKCGRSGWLSPPISWLRMCLAVRRDSPCIGHSQIAVGEGGHGEAGWVLWCTRCTNRSTIRAPSVESAEKEGWVGTVIDWHLRRNPLQRRSLWPREDEDV
jgi:hypothetical protein